MGSAMLWSSWLKSLTIVQIFLGYIYVSSSCIIAMLQLCALIVKPISSYTYRYMNIRLVELVWYQIMFLPTWWCGSSFHIYSDISLDTVGCEHALVIMNHCYELDFIIAWLGALHFNMLGSAKIVAKKALKHLPLVGWQFASTESIFLSRDWSVDKHNLMNDLLKCTLCPRPAWVLLCPEGTRFTPEKHRASLDYLKKKELPPFKHHLAPRPKGFYAAITALKGKFPAVYDITIGIRDNSTGKEPSFLSMLAGVPFHAELVYRRMDLDTVPIDTLEDTTEYLYNLYHFKDETMEYFYDHKTFEGFKDFMLKPYVDKSHWALLIVTVWVILLGLPLIVLLIHLLISAAYWALTVIAVVVLIVSLGMRKIISYTEKSKSSEYGSAPKKQI